jgi:hypothetical protein
MLWAFCFQWLDIDGSINYKRKFKQWWSVISTISTKRTIITSHWTQKSPRHIKLGIQMLALDRQTNVAGLNQQITSFSSYIYGTGYDYPDLPGLGNVIGARVAQWVRWLDYLTAHTSLSPIRRGFAHGFVNYKKGTLDSQPQVIQFTSCLPMVGGSLRVQVRILNIVGSRNTDTLSNLFMKRSTN